MTGSPFVLRRTLVGKPLLVDRLLKQRAQLHDIHLAVLDSFPAAAFATLEGIVCQLVNDVSFLRCQLHSGFM
jgi:hypothetical protein